MKEGLLTVLEDYPKFNNLLEFYQNGKEGEVLGLDDSSQNFFIANLRKKIEKNLLIITPNTQKADSIYEDLVRLIGERNVLLFPGLEILPHESLEVEENSKLERLRVLENLVADNNQVVIAPIQALLQTIISSKLYKEYRIDLTINTELITTQLSSKLIEMGYTRVARVEDKGQFSIKGGIVDIAPCNYQSPVRIELFGDEIESIREFSLVDQRSKNELTEITIGPATEFILPKSNIKSGVEDIKKDLESQIEDTSEEIANKLKEKIKYDLERIKEGIQFPEIRQYLNYFYEPSTLLDYFKGIIIFDNPIKVREAAINFLSNINQTYSFLLEQGKVLCSYQELFMDFNKFFYGIKDYKLYLAPTSKRVDYIDLDFSLEFSSRKLQSFQGKIDLFINDLKDYFAEEYRILVGLSSLSKAEKLQERLQDAKLPVTIVKKVTDQLKVGNIILTTGNLGNGFLLSEPKFIFYTDHELFKKTKRKRKRTKAFDQGVKLSSFSDLKQNDHVVHENHGVGKYLGIKTLQVQGKSKDYLVLLYANDDKLYIPTDQVDLIQKYVALNDKEPRLHKLDGDNWNKAKARVKKSVEEMAEELLELYAKREMKRGYSYSEDTVWQREFEDAFPYQETPDQLEAIKDVKDDMESKQPMDRLLCGDVGYGKTEVAIRAIFKAVMEGKQAAFLVPTTILAQQHWNNLVDRFADYPINVAMLSRFRTASQQKEIIKGLELGTVDVVIGTHRLLSRDTKFKDLGLVVVDEEQRFGVKQKERLKQLKKSVDVLTLTATPIPRTLHMSLVGVRDISIIETPPKNRYPIRTYVGEHDPDLIQEALMRELNRGGQVYFVHNRVKDINKMASQLQELVPQAEIAVAHGQMSEIKLEELMLDFLEGRYDILVCTTIIETGMDISNVNTIIINNADKLGLGQLYQLRGRVGRTNRIAYAYLLHDQNRILSEIAEKRLKAIKEFTNLGSGFKIAMRDLEIRGAGNILGPEQHGHIEAVGFSLYCKLLEEAVKELQNEEVEEEHDITLELKVTAYLPDEYISDAEQKIEIYKKVEAILNFEDYEKLKEELRDRFGNLPTEVMILLDLAKIRIKGSQVSLLEIKEKGKELQFKFSKEHKLSGEKLVKLSQNFAKLKFVASNEPKIKVQVDNLKDQQKINLIIKILEFLSPTKDNYNN